MLSAVNDVPASPTAAGFQVNSGSVVNAEAFEQATAIAAAKAVRLKVGDWKNWQFMFSAASTSSAVICSPIAQPTMRRLQTSSTTAQA